MNKPESSNAQFPFNWKAFENMLGGQLSSILPDPSLINLRDSSWIGDYVKQLIQQAQQTDRTSTPEKSLDYDLSETSRSVICKINIPKQTNPNLIRIWLNAQQLRIVGIPHSQQKHTIALPVRIVTKTSQAVYKKGVLEIRMPKYMGKRKFREIYVQFEDLYEE